MRHPLVKNVAQFIRQNQLLQYGSKVVVAVSGGADSVALLNLLLQMEDLGLSLIVAHLNHCLRGEESDGDESFVRQLSLGHGLPFVSKRVDVADVARRRGLSLEQAGREVRYAFFDDVASDLGASVVALAHHADDQAETVLMRLIRGSAGSGLCGMLPKSRDGRYVRPLLATTRQEIEDHLFSQSISFRTDSSNRDTRFLRNSVRHDLLPLLQKYNPAISARLVSASTALALDEEVLRGATHDASRRVRVAAGEGICFAIDLLKAEPKGLRMRLFRMGVEEIKGDLTHISVRNLEDIDNLILSGTPQAMLDLPCGLGVIRSYDRLTIKLRNDAPSEPFEFSINSPGEYLCPGGRVLRVSMQDHVKVDGHSGAAKAILDHDKAPFPWRVRSWRPGDRFRPLGMQGTKKVKDMFIDMKIPQRLRRSAPLIVADGRIVWIGGVRAGEDARITERTKVSIMAEIIDVTE